MSAPADTAAPLLSLQGVRYAWPGQAQAAVAVRSLVLAPGETLFLHGPSGSGKSTLLSLLAGVLVAQQGRIELRGRDWARLSRAGRDRQRVDQVGYIFQQFNLLPYLSVLDNVLLPCRFSTLRREAAVAAAGSAEAQARQLLAATDLAPELWARPAGHLSVGQQQRVAAARALIGRPALVIADEPTSALDEDRRDAFMDLLLGACAQAGSGLVFVSHDARLAARFARRVSIAELAAASEATA